MTTQLFPNPEFPTSNVSIEFTISDTLMLIQFMNFINVDPALTNTAVLEFKYVEDCDISSWEPVNWCCGLSKNVQPTNHWVLPQLPGTYRIAIITTDSGGSIAPYDPAMYEDLRVQYTKVKPAPNLTQYHPTCC